MRVHVERCWAGNNKYFFRLILPNGNRESISSDGDYSDWWHQYFYYTKREAAREFRAMMKGVGQ